MKKIFTTLLLVYCVTLCKAQNWEWLRGPQAIFTNNSSNAAEGWGIASDDSGDAYLWGNNQFQHEIFDNDTLGNVNLPDVLAKYNAAGNFKWAIKISNNGNATCKKICGDHEGNVYVTGYLGSNGSTFGSIYLNQNSTDSLGHGRFFLVKYDKNGNVVYAKKFGGHGMDKIIDIAVNSNGEIFTMGSFDTSIYTIGNTTLQGDSLCNVFLVKFTSLGNIVWAKGASGNYQSSLSVIVPTEIATDHLGNCFMTGLYSTSIFTLDGFTLINNTGWINTFFVKYSNDGNVIWAQNSDGTGMTGSQHITTDGVGNIYMSGDHEDTTLSYGAYTLHFGNTSFGTYLLKFNTSGNVIWGKVIKGGAVYQLACDSKNNVYIDGGFSYDGMLSPIDITLDTLFLPWPSDAGIDPMYIAKFSKDGNILFAATLPSGGDDKSAIAIDGNDEVYVGGDYWDTMVVAGVDSLYPYTTVQSFTTAEQLFVAKYSKPIEDGIDISEIYKESSLYIIPNPCNTCEITGATNSTDLTVTDIVGRKINASFSKSANGFYINLPEDSKGIFFIRNIKTGEVVKFVKQ